MKLIGKTNLKVRLFMITSATCCHTSSMILLKCHNKYHRLWGFHGRHLFSCSCGGWESRIKVLTNFVCSEGLVIMVDGHLLFVSSCGLSLESMFLDGLCGVSSYKNSNPTHLVLTLSDLSYLFVSL